MPTLETSTSSTSPGFIQVGGVLPMATDIEDQIVEPGVLHADTIEPRLKLQLGRIGDFVGGHHIGADTAGGGEVLADR